VVAGALTGLVIAYTRRIAKRIQEQAERRKNLEKERNEFRQEIERLNIILSEKDSEIERLTKQAKEWKNMMKDYFEETAPIMNEMRQMMDEITEKLKKDIEKKRARELKKKEE